MFKSISELKKFLIWSKQQGIQHVKVGDVEVLFSGVALLPAELTKEITNSGATTLAESEPLDPKEEDELLFHSSGM